MKFAKVKVFLDVVVPFLIMKREFFIPSNSLYFYTCYCNYFCITADKR